MRQTRLLLTLRLLRLRGPLRTVDIAEPLGLGSLRTVLLMAHLTGMGFVTFRWQYPRRVHWVLLPVGERYLRAIEERRHP